MKKMNDQQQLEAEKLIEAIICPSCSVENDEKDCSGCELFAKIKENLFQGCM